MDMFLNHLITILFLSCVGNGLQDVPPCNEPLSRNVQVNSGDDDVDLDVTSYLCLLPRISEKEYEYVQFAFMNGHDGQTFEICLLRLERHDHHPDFCQILYQFKHVYESASASASASAFS